MTLRPVPPKRLWLLALGFGVWCLAIVVIYALHGFGCAFAWSTDTMRLTFGLALLVHLAVIGRAWRAYSTSDTDSAFGPTGDFLRWVVVLTLITAFVAVPLTLGPVLVLNTCV